MNEFNELIKKTIEKVVNNRALYSKSEVAVRDQVINPILTFFGWDTTDPKFVIPNARTEDNDIPDYTLLKNGVTQAYVEAKKIAHNLKDNMHQLARYCTNRGVEYGIMTNGIEWILFKSFEKGKSMNERILWTINIEHDPTELILRRLNTISIKNIENISELTKKDDIITQRWNKIAASPLLLKNEIVRLIEGDLKKDEINFESFEINEFVHNKLESITNIEQNATSTEFADTTIIAKNAHIAKKLPENNSGDILIFAKLKTYPDLIIRYYNLIETHLRSLGHVEINERKTMVTFYYEIVKRGKAIVWIQPHEKTIKLTLSKNANYPDNLKRIVPGWGHYPEIVFEINELEKNFEYIKKLLSISYRNICDK